MNKDNNLTISAPDVKEFKTTYCDENTIIKNLLKKEFLLYFEGLILDVGSGTADILSEVIPNKKVVHLDVLDFSDVKVPPDHIRITGDFFDRQLIEKLGPIDVLFMSHIQQFIDSDLNVLKATINLINPKRIMLVEDMNDDFLGKVMKFSIASFPKANPEVKIADFPYGYTKIKSVSFTATLKCPTFLELAKQCLYLMDVVHSEENMEVMSQYLSKNLSNPMFTINQEINVYEINQP